MDKMDEMLQILDELEEKRQYYAEKFPSNTDADFLIRSCCATVAMKVTEMHPEYDWVKAYAEHGRCAWTDVLKKYPESHHARRIADGTFHL